MVTIKKKLVVVIIVLVLLSTYIFVIKPYFFQGKLSDEMIADANQEFDSVIESMSTDVENEIEVPSSEQNVSGVNSESDLKTPEETQTQKVVEPLENNESKQPNQDSIDPEGEQIETQETSPPDNTNLNESQNIEHKVVLKTGDETPRESSENVALTDEQKAQKIEKKYQSGLKKLEDKAESLLGQLISEAKLEYSALSDDQKNSFVVTSQMASNYIARADSLEKLVDKAVNELLSNMEKELADEDLSVSSVEKYRKEYEKRKKERQSELLTKALSYQP